MVNLYICKHLYIYILFQKNPNDYSVKRTFSQKQIVFKDFEDEFYLMYFISTLQKKKNLKFR